MTRSRSWRARRQAAESIATRRPCRAVLGRAAFVVSAAMVPRTRTDTVAVRIPRRRFTIDEYHRMGDAGVLTEDDRVELLDGEIVRMSPIGTPHASTVARLNTLFVRRFGGQRDHLGAEPDRARPLVRAATGSLRARPARRLLCERASAPTRRAARRRGDGLEPRLRPDAQAAALCQGRAPRDLARRPESAARSRSTAVPRSAAIASRTPYARGRTITPLAFPRMRRARDRHPRLTAA